MCHILRFMSTTNSQDELRLACKLAGGQAQLGEAIGKSQGHVSKWLERGLVPADQCPAIEAHIDTIQRGAVRCERLNSTVEWVRDRRGRATHYRVPVQAA